MYIDIDKIYLRANALFELYEKAISKQYNSSLFDFCHIYQSSCLIYDGYSIWFSKLNIKENGFRKLFGHLYKS
jgi:hypothetical protein